MTIEEAIHELKIQSQVLESMILYNKDFEPKNDNTSLENKKNAINIGIKALEKQIPKKATNVRYFGEAGYYIAYVHVVTAEIIQNFNIVGIVDRQ